MKARARKLCTTPKEKKKSLLDTQISIPDQRDRSAAPLLQMWKVISSVINLHGASLSQVRVFFLKNLSPHI